MKRENLYLTSDLHFYHVNICKYCNRPYDKDTITNMNEDILAEFDKLPAGSTVLNLGDLYMNSSKTFDDIKYIVDRMKSNNKKLEIVLGNHDRSTCKYMKNCEYDNPVELFTALGFDRVYDKPFVMDNMVFCHEPVWFPKGVKVVHGHTHDKDIDDFYFCEISEDGKEVDSSFYYNMCWDKHHSIINYNDFFESEN